MEAGVPVQGTAAEKPDDELRSALARGYERIPAWADVLDRINLFPVADGDTGRNLVVSLAPLRDTSASAEAIVGRLLLSARGNSGNIAVGFVTGLLRAPRDLGMGVRFARGAERARQSVAAPQPGTMIGVLDAVAQAMAAGVRADNVDAVLGDLVRVVKRTTEQLDVLRDARVVDSGALGMLVFFDGFLHSLAGASSDGAIADDFGTLADFRRDPSSGGGLHGCCLDAVLRIDRDRGVDRGALDRIGRDVVSMRDGDILKVHVHVDDLGAAKGSLERLGEVLRWSWDDFAEQSSRAPAPLPRGWVHVMTDGAASVSRQDAEELGVTLLDSYLTIGEISVPESRILPEDEYSAIRRNVRVTTSQASTFERHQHYERITSHYENVLYLCVGSVYTGNHDVASAWTAQHPLGKRMAVIDSGAASGRLAVAVWATARLARSGGPREAVEAFARTAIAQAEEYIFPEKLEYLARGGRMSKTSAFFADMIHVAPVISPLPDGARKVAMVRKSEDKVAFACDRIAYAIAPAGNRGLVLLEHTDNREWVEGHLAARVRDRFPDAECHVRPLSATTGAHTGPGTWAVAVLPAFGT
jgi:uncharacterized protein